MNLELFYREFQSIKLKLLYINLLHLSVILNISNSLPSTAKLLHRIIKKTSTYVQRGFSIPSSCEC